MSFFKFINPKYHSVKKEIKLYSKLKMKDDDLLIKLEELCEYQKVLTNYNKIKEELPKGYKHHQYQNIFNDLYSIKDITFDFNLSHTEYYELKEKLLEGLMHFSRNKLNLNNYLHIFDNKVIDLLIPIRIELSNSDYIILKEHMDLLEELNFFDIAISLKASNLDLCKISEIQR